MGNNNSSGVNEGTTSGVQQNLSQMDTLAEARNEGNLKMSVAGSKNYLGTDARLASPKDTTNQLQKGSPEEDAREDKMQEPQKFSDSQLESILTVQSDQKKDSIKQVELAEAGTVKSESLAVSSSRDIEDFTENPNELLLAEVTSDNQIDKEVSIKQAICEEIKMIQNQHETCCIDTTQKESKTNITYAEKYKYMSYDSSKESENLVGTSIFIGISQDNQAVEAKPANNQNQERRLSCVSNSENLNIYFQKQKTPSFDFDLRIKASPKEFDQTPLLNQNKIHADNLSGQCDTVHLSLNSQAEYGQAQLQYTSASQDEKLATSEKKYCDTSQAPKLGLSNENEKPDAQTTANKREKQVSATPPKAKEKRKRKSSPFSNFMCCATVIN